MHWVNALVLGGACVALSAAAGADTIHLKGGGKLANARIVEDRGATVVIEVQSGTGTARVVLARDDVERIERTPPKPTPAKRPADLDKAFGLLRAHQPVQAMLLLKPYATAWAGVWQGAAHYGFSLAYEQLGKLDEAEKAVRLARVMAKGDPWIAFHEAHLRHRRGKFTAAVQGYKHAYALDPENRALKAAVRAAIAAAKAGVAAPDPAAGRARATFDRSAGNVADAAAAATAVLANTSLELRGDCTALHVHCDAPAPVLDGYARGGDAVRFRQGVQGVRAQLTVAATFHRAGQAARAMCLRQIHSALAHRYPGAQVIVEAFDPAPPAKAGKQGQAGKRRPPTRKVRAAAWWDGAQVQVAFDPPVPPRPVPAPPG